MANTYRNIWKADATTNIVTVYTCPAETVALVDSVLQKPFRKSQFLATVAGLIKDA